MKMRMRLLIILNCLFYCSFILYSYLYKTIEMKGLYALIAFLPHFLCILSAFVLFERGKKYSFKITIQLIVDMIARIINFFLIFYVISIDSRSNSFKFLCAVILLLVLVNIVIEAILYEGCKNDDKESIEKLKKFFEYENIIKYSNSEKVKKSKYDIFILWIVSIIILGINQTSSKGYIFFMSLVCTFLLVVYFIRNYRLCKCMYKDQKVIKHQYIKENIFVVVSIVIGVISAYCRYYEYVTNEYIIFALFLLQCIFLYPKFLYRSDRIKMILDEIYNENDL